MPAACRISSAQGMKLISLAFTLLSIAAKAAGHETAVNRNCARPSPEGASDCGHSQRLTDTPCLSQADILLVYPKKLRFIK
jgi:hypothetical protein